MLKDILLVLDSLLLHQLLQISPFSAKIRGAVDHVLHGWKPVQVVLNPDVKGS